MAQNLNKIFHKKNKVRIAGSNTVLQGFSPKEVDKLKSEQDKKAIKQKRGPRPRRVGVP